MRLPRIALTMGDPAGVGPELAVRLVRAVSAEANPPAEILLYAASDVVEEAVRRFAPGLTPTVVPCSDLKFADIRPGTLDARCGLCAVDCFRAGTLDAIAGKVDAVVTCPINKAAVNLAGIPFTGHTELLASLCGVKDFVMMQSAGDLRVVFVTTHISLAEVPAAVTAERIRTVTHLLRDAIAEEGIANPKIGVAALNPHAGENGNMGMEDENVVKPAVRALLDEGIPAEKLLRYGLEYRFVTLYLQGELTREQLREQLYIAICQFAKRQMTWLRVMEKDGITVHWTEAVPF